jgi:quercetin dioxygenase-like cupin family protein
MTARRISGLLVVTAITACLPALADEPVPMQRLTPSEISALVSPSAASAAPPAAATPATAGTSTTSGTPATSAPPATAGTPPTRSPPTVQMTPLIGDPTKPGLYTVRVNIAPHTQVRPHTHRDNRSVTVISGTWHMGYGGTFDAKALKDLPPGSFYTEPAGQAHFAQTGDEPVVIWVTGYGPSDTKFVTP